MADTWGDIEASLTPASPEPTTTPPPPVETPAPRPPAAPVAPPVSAAQPPAGWNEVEAQLPHQPGAVDTVTDVAHDFLAATTRVLGPIEYLQEKVFGIHSPRLSEVVQPVDVKLENLTRPAVDQAAGALKGVLENKFFRAAESVTNWAIGGDQEFNAAQHFEIANNSNTAMGKAIGGLAADYVALYAIGAPLGELASTAVLKSVSPKVAEVLGPTMSKVIGNAQNVESYYAAAADPLAYSVAKPAIVRATEMIGRSIGVGAVEAAATAVLPTPPGQEPVDPIRAGVNMAVTNMAFETATVLGVKAFSRGAREIDKQAIAAEWEGSSAKQFLTETADQAKADLFRTRNQLDRALNVENQARNAAQYFTDLGGATPVNPEAFVAGRVAALNDLGEATAARVALAEKLPSLTNNAVIAAQIAGIGPKEIQAGMYLGQTPANFEGSFGWMRAKLRQGLSSMDAVRKDMGVSGEWVLRQVDNSLISSELRGANSRVFVDQTITNAINLMESEGSHIDGNRLIRRAYLEAWEPNAGPEATIKLLTDNGVSASTAAKVAAGMGQIDDMLRGIGEVSQSIGGEAIMDEATLARNRVGHYIPQIANPDTASTHGERIRSYLIAQGMAPEIATDKTLEIVQGRERRGMLRFGSADEQRQIAGSTAEKIKYGIDLIDDPIVAIKQYVTRMHQRIGLAQVLGWNGEMREPFVEAVRREMEAAHGHGGIGGASLFQETLDTLAGLKYIDENSQRYALIATNLQTTSKLGMSWIANAWQTPLNNPLLFGANNTAKGAWEALRNETPETLAKAQGFINMNVFEQGLRENLAATGDNYLTSRAARFVLKATPFNMEERYARAAAVNGAIASMTDIIQKAQIGRLKGENLNFARRLFNEAGLDLTTVLREGVSDDQMMVGALRLARRTQFGGGAIGRALKPSAWTTPMGRVVTQFNSYALNQGRLMRDFVLNEIARGNYRQLNRFLGFYLPTADVAVTINNSIRNWMLGDNRKRPENPYVRMIEDFLMPGSLGILQSMLYGDNPALTVLGPTFRDIANTAQAFRRGGLAGGTGATIRNILRQPSVRYFATYVDKGYKGGRAAREAAQQYQDAWDADMAKFGIDRREGAQPDYATLKDFIP